MSERTRTELSERWSKILAIGLPVVAVLLAIIAINVVGSVLIARDLRDDYASLLEEARAVEPSEAGQPAAAEPAADAGAPDERPQVDVELTLGEFWIEADVDEVPAYAEVTFHVTNEGETAHDATVGDAGTAMLEPGESDSFTVEADRSGVLELTCTVPGHESGGMALDLPIAGEDEAEGEATQTASAESEPDDAAEAASPENASEYDGERPEMVRRDPAAPPPPEGDLVEVNLAVTEEVAQVAPDVWQEVWTFGGQVPAPVIRAKVGDTVRITVEVPDDAQVPHSIDFHASQTAWNNQMVDIAPGDDLVYEFEATHAGVFMYHCGTAPTLHHIGNGMYGAMIVEPADGLEEVDHEMVFVQSEFYLGPQGEPGDFEKMSQGAPDPDLVVFNGVADQYAEEPIQVGVEDSVRAWVLNAGPNVDSSFHIVGTIFDRVVKEGVELAADNPGRWGSQAVDLAPAQGAFVEFTLAEDGLYPIVTHAFNHASMGALGMFQAGDGGASVDGGH